MPVISIFTGSMDFSNLAIEIGNTSIKYGSFLTAVLDFIIIAFSIFLMVRYINKLNKKLEEVTEDGIKKLEKQGKLKRRKTDTPDPGPTTKVCPFCFSEVNIQATRCPHCTSILETEAEVEKSEVEEEL